MTKEKKRSSLAKKVCDFFERYQMLVVPIGYLITMMLAGVVCLISRIIAYAIGKHDAEVIIAIIIFVVIVIVEIGYEQYLERKGQKLEGEADERITSDKTE